ncbi:nucleotidyltransferase domain-containing protein [Kitasatospora griseola]|uniref:nucleotidyltransferase domain-containing protein n=1 Tax=Kitasatospora griseola TaxID=2064 RepID=UPI0034169982
MDIPTLHGDFLDEVLPRMRQDGRFVGVALTGSIAAGDCDEYSDVDLVLAVDDAAYDAVVRERLALIGSWTSLVAGFTGEHVGEPRLIVTLVGPPLLHVDFKFVRASDFAERTTDPEILWDRDGQLVEALAERPLAAPEFDLQWIEDRFWVWVHYGATKLGRGELFETIGFLSYLRDTVLGPLAAHRAGADPRGVRRLETVAPEAAHALRATLCGYDHREAGQAILAAAELYRRWFEEVGGPTVERRRHAEKLALQYLHEVIEEVSGEVSEER